MLHVAAAAVVAPDGRVLIARRPLHLHQGGLWEFPGGKVEPGEDFRQALNRELHEELGIDVVQARPLLRIPYRYPDREIVLDVWRVDTFHGEPQGREGQEVRWVALAELPHYAFPPPNRPIITALQLPDRYLITPEPDGAAHWPHFLQQLEQALGRGVRLVQLRAKQLAEGMLRELAPAVVAVCRRHGARVLLNGTPELAADLAMDGVHLSSAMLWQQDARPAVLEGWLVAASCHSGEDLARACDIGADFAVLSPVQGTRSHPGAPSLGWERFAQLAAQSRLPVYALGGMMPQDIPRAWQHGAQGIAAISGLWE